MRSPRKATVETAPDKGATKPRSGERNLAVDEASTFGVAKPTVNTILTLEPRSGGRKHLLVKNQAVACRYPAYTPWTVSLFDTVIRLIVMVS